MILVHINVGSTSDRYWDDRADQFLMAAFNKLPSNITAENISKREFRAWLLSVTEELNGRKVNAQYDVIDVSQRLQQLRKAGRLRKNKSEHISVVTSKETTDDGTADQIPTFADVQGEGQ